jgi:imidazolonepropionase-like amidohydrolase
MVNCNDEAGAEQYVFDCVKPSGRPDLIDVWDDMAIGTLFRRMSWLRAVLCILSVAIGQLLSVAAHAQVTAIRAGAVIDPDAGRSMANQTILVEGGVIKAIGQDIAIPPEATIIDLSDQSVLPGLIDAHTHLLAAIDPKWDLGDDWIMTVQRREGYRAILGARNAAAVLNAGFTTVRDVGNSGFYLDMDLAKAIRFKEVPGPTIIPAGRIIAPFGGQFWSTPTNPQHLHMPEFYFADSRDEMRKAIRENIYWGAKVIKIVVDQQRYSYTADDIRFIVEEAGRAGVKVAAHVQTEQGAHAAIEAKVASLEHAWNISDADLALAKNNGVALVSTDFTVFQLVSGHGMIEDSAKKIHAKYVERLKRAYKAGVTLVFGSDVMSNITAPSRGDQALEYIDSFVEAGVSAPDILRAMTSNAAVLLGVEMQRGSLRPGMAADLIAVPNNPLSDINVLKKVSFVMRNGVIHRHDKR